MSKSSHCLTTMLDDLKLDKTASNIVVKKLVNIAIPCTCYIFCCINKSLTNPELLDCKVDFNSCPCFRTFYMLFVYV